MSKYLKITPEKCIGCKACELACSLMNEGEMNPARARIAALLFREDKLYTLPYNYPTTCRQCADAPCLASCPVNAILAVEGESRVVSIDSEKCIGCGRCVSACPFGAMSFDGEGRKPFKCQLCGGAEPACATICPTGSILFEEREAFFAQPAFSRMKGFSILRERNRKNIKRKRRAPDEGQGA